ncbi:MAG: circadian clock protein KaiC [Deltaproteobacteria bacterium]
MKSSESRGVEQMPTGIPGFDGLLEGGLPRDRTTLVVGGPGAGKTLFALQTLVNGARLLGEPGIFVAFEEPAGNILAHADCFGWDLPGLRRKKLFFLDARVSQTAIHGGEFDLLGLLAGIDAKRRELGARRVVFDGIDVLLGLLDDPASERKEMFRLADWISTRALTGLVTCKGADLEPGSAPREGYVQYLADCVIELRRERVGSASVRQLQIAKCRGLSHATGQVPFVIGDAGLEVLTFGGSAHEVRVSTEKLPTGIPRLDRMAGGGYFRGSSILVSGAPGTAKSTLAGAFAAASARRGERTLYVSFDESPSQLLRNLSSVGLHLAPQVRAGALVLRSLRRSEGSAIEHVTRILRELSALGAKALIVDPISALSGGGDEALAEDAAIRLFDGAKVSGVTVFSTSLLGGSGGLTETTAAGLSTVVDTWIHVSYVVRGGERNRALTIVKSRGTGHSNQVRELILGSTGLDLADVYRAGDEVLMGTLRWQKEAQEREQRLAEQRQSAQRRREAELALAEGRAQLAAIRREVFHREATLKQLGQEVDESQRRRGERALALGALRQGDDRPMQPPRAEKSSGARRGKVRR